MNQVYDYWSRRKLAESVSMSHTMVNQFVRAGKISVEEFGLPVPAALRELAKVLQGNDKMISARERALMLSEDMERRLDGQSAPEELSVEDIVERVFMQLDKRFDDVLPKLAASGNVSEIEQILGDHYFEVYEAVRKDLNITD